ncbi:MAG: glycosyltransferase family A protein [Desulfurococcus sp.]|uniref:glycosyltransferase n=1 Tax=Desulfurococcus sp. TaxID=51678 RepID=UPI0031645A9D
MYGTVFNNAQYVEESIKSVFNPSYDIVIVDSYSTDGTWEKLLELRKEYNLTLYRYRSSRGLGRHIALYKCPEGSITAYFDLDTIYSTAFHRIIGYAENIDPVYAYGTLVGRREYILSRGGWKDFMVGEDIDLFVRVGFKVSFPIPLGLNAPAGLKLHAREKRYARGFLEHVKRVVKGYLDYYYSNGYTPPQLFIFKVRSGILLSPMSTLLYFIKGSNRYFKNFSNRAGFEIMLLFKMRNPREIGIDDALLCVGVSTETIKMLGGVREIDNIVLNRVGKAYRASLKLTTLKILYFKSVNVIPYAEGLFNKVESIDVVEP